MAWIVAAGLAAAVVLAALVVAGLYGAEQLTRPARCALDDSAERWGLPEPEPVSPPAADGVRLSGWWFQSPQAAAAVVVCHGHGGNKMTSLWLATGLFPRFSVLLLDLRGHGDSEGDRTSVGYLERLDVVGAVHWVREQAGPIPIGLLGISMGAAAVILAAAECREVAAVVADSPFARLRTPVRFAIAARGYPRALAPVLAWAVELVAGWRLGMRHRTRLDPIDVVAGIAPRPLLLIHGQADELIPVEESHALWHLAGEPKEQWVLPEVGHARVADVEPRAYADRVAGFFERFLAPAQASAGRAT